MRVRTAIEAKLVEAFAPVRLTVADESGRHAGHAGARPEGETHFRVELVSTAFTGRPRAERQRMVHRVLAAELAGGVHALELRLLAPDEAAG